ncbi:MAG: decarboxylating NADP(+)-dependent phosphogluconate dehydrogenase [bacterium]
MQKKADIGLIGLAVMGENLVLNMESNGYTVAVFNRTVEKVDQFMQNKASGKNIIGTHSIQEFIDSLSVPKTIMLMVKAGSPVDDFMDQLIPFLEKGDILIDGGNSYYPDTIRRCKKCENHGLYFIGTGVSGGEEGALKGPSIMPGGHKEAWKKLKNIFQKISAKAPNGVPCCNYVGPDGAGHFVKMTHNGIEYADMQLICEAYSLLKNVLGLNSNELAEIFKKWNEGDLDSYLIDITANILARKDDKTKNPLVEMILDTAGQKGTGKWTSESALNLGISVPTIAEAVFARCISAIKDERVNASSILSGPSNVSFKGDKEKFVESIRIALYTSKICCYAQGFALMKAATKEYNWGLDFGDIALMWRNGCIIRARFLEKIKNAFKKNPNLDNLLLDPYFNKIIKKSQKKWRDVVITATKLGIAIPAFSSALAYYDSYRCDRLPANLLQAQRDYFGAHTYERTDCPRGQFFHTKWIV